MSSVLDDSTNLEPKLDLDKTYEDDSFLNDNILSTFCCSSNIKSDCYLKKIEQDANEEIEDLIPKLTENTLNKFDFGKTEHTVYYHCPICLSSGFKTIQHIKQCANKHFLNPKDVLVLLKKCPKTTRTKFADIKRPNKKKEIQNSEKSYELLLFNDDYRQQQINKKVSKLLLKTDKCEINNEIDLPFSWKLSYLNYDANFYIIEGFNKYFS